jgi:hypothetical protein
MVEPHVEDVLVVVGHVNWRSWSTLRTKVVTLALFATGAGPSDPL